MQTITLGAGCFWCVEAVFQNIKGVKEVVSGYTGGATEKPTYQDICTGTTGHAEVCKISFDPEITSLKEILEVFWGTHDPTTLNRQGNDVGDQYRSAIYYHNAEQKDIAEEMLRDLDASDVFEDPIVTEITPAPEFFPAEGYHQNYYNDNPGQSYCTFIIGPKLEKLRYYFKEKTV